MDNEYRCATCGGPRSKYSAKECLSCYRGHTARYLRSAVKILHEWVDLAENATAGDNDPESVKWRAEAQEARLHIIPALNRLAVAFDRRQFGK